MLKPRSQSTPSSETSPGTRRGRYHPNNRVTPHYHTGHGGAPRRECRSERTQTSADGRSALQSNDPSVINCYGDGCKPTYADVARRTTTQHATTPRRTTPQHATTPRHTTTTHAAQPHGVALLMDRVRARADVLGLVPRLEHIFTVKAKNCTQKRKGAKAVRKRLRRMP